MTTFSMWWTGFKSKPVPKQVLWLCGTEVVLIDEIRQATKDALHLAPWNYVSLAVGDVSERQVWAEVAQYPTDGENRLVVIRNAEKLEHPEHITTFVKRRIENPKTHLIFISNDESPPRLEPTKDQRDRRVKGDLLPHLAVLSAGRGQVIECRPFTQGTAKHAVAWVQSKVTMRSGVATKLLERANGDLRFVRDLCEKLAVFSGEVTITTVNGLLSQRPRDTFENSLLALDKATALLALDSIPMDEYSRIIGALDQRLELAGTVHDAILRHESAAEIARSMGRQGFLVPDIYPVAKHYDAKRRLAIRDMLTVLDEHLHLGARTGVLEALVMYW